MYDENFMGYVRSNIQDTLSQDKQYMFMQSECVKVEKSGNVKLQEEIQYDMEARAEELCFIAGFNAAIRIMANANVKTER